MNPKRLQRPQMLGREKPSLSNAALTVAFCLLVALLLLHLVFVTNYFGVLVSGRSMEGTLFDGDCLYADKTAIPERGDVIIVDVTDYPEFQTTQKDKDGRRHIIKRLIAVEGDVVRISEGMVYLRLAGEEEFRLLEEDYATGKIPLSGQRDFAVGEGEIFFLGDNRAYSKDCSVVGCLKRTDIEGVVPKWAIERKELIKKWETFRLDFGFTQRENQS